LVKLFLDSGFVSTLASVLVPVTFFSTLAGTPPAFFSFFGDNLTYPLISLVMGVPSVRVTDLAFKKLPWFGLQEK